MRVHGDKILRRRDGVTGLNDYKDARDILEEDFQNTCGYCGKDKVIMHEKFHIDHFVPRKLDKDRENDYYNLVLACPKCNLSKSDKWPTGNPGMPNDGKEGFIDPATDEFDEHVGRDESGYVIGITDVGKSMCKMLHLDIRRTDIYWKISEMKRCQDKMDALFKQGKLDEQEKNFYIENNIILKEYIDEAFSRGE